jgi:hypothetical protein
VLNQFDEEKPMNERKDFLGFPWSDCRIQDSFHVATVYQASDKRKHIESHFSSVVKESPHQLCINFCSGVSNYGLAFPNHIAKRTNDQVFSHRGHLGIVVMDFPS